MKSIWSKTCNIEGRPSLNNDIEAGVAVIGGGMAGILAAYELEQAGVHTVLLEADRIGGGQTKNTTAKITSQHGMFCHTFIKNKGIETAKLYVQANQNAIEENRRIIEKEQIMRDTGKAVKGLTKRFFYIPDETTAALERGQGSIVETSRGKAGVYKTEEGEIFQVEIVCPHLGCELSWNPDEKTWDCPCHGSRFDYKGKLLEGPAQEGIESSQADEPAER